MIQSASILPIVEIMDWGRAVPPDTLLTPVTLEAPIDAADYRLRDQELAYRDLIVSALLTEVAIQVGDVWHFAPSRPQLPAFIPGELEYETADSPATPEAPGSVTPVDNSSVPKDALTADQGLYARDLVLHEALYQVASVLVDNPVTSLSELSPSEAWSLAQGLRERLACIGYNFPLSTALFATPDRDLASRDNQLAAFISQLQLTLANIFTRANRLLVKITDREAEPYVLTSDTSAERVWSAYPLLSNGGLQVRYDKATQTVTWVGEQPVTSAPLPQALVTPVNGGTMTVQGAVPSVPGSNFYRQKAARLCTTPYSERLLFQTSAPERYVTLGGIYQPSAVLFPVPGQAEFSLPIIVPTGCYRIGLQVQPSRSISLLGFLGTIDGGAINGTAATLTEPGTITYLVSLPAGRSTLQLDLTDLTAATPSFDVEILVNDDLAFEGAFTFNRAAGTSVLTQQLELNYDIDDDLSFAPATIVIRWRGGAGEFTLNQLLLTTPAPEDNTVSYTLQALISTSSASVATTAVTSVGIPERQDIVWFDARLTAPMVNPTLSISFQGGNPCALYIRGYDIRIFEAQATLATPSALSPHKSALATRALTCTQQAWKTALLTSPTDPRTLNDDGVYVWDATANARWIDMIAGGGDTLVTSAFFIAGPGDIGRPALLPNGLVLDSDGSTILATLPLAQLTPCFMALQAWMLEFNPRVAGPEFWPQSDQACASTGGVSNDTSSSFSWSQSVPSADAAGIVGISCVSTMTGVPDGSSFTAYTIANSGPSGGTIAQTVTITVALSGLVVGTAYEITTSWEHQAVTGGATSSDSAVYSFTADAATTEIVLDTLTAATGYQDTVQSVVLSVS